MKNTRLNRLCTSGFSIPHKEEIADSILVSSNMISKAIRAISRSAAVSAPSLLPTNPVFVRWVPHGSMRNKKM